MQTRPYRDTLTHVPVCQKTMIMKISIDLSPMSASTCLALAVAALLVSACTGDPARGPDAMSRAQVTPIEQDSYLQSLYADARLDPIRDKVTLLLRPGAIKSNHLSNDARAQFAERKAIAAWVEVRERAQAYQTQRNGPPSMMLAQTRKQISAAIVQLQAGKLSYGDFARRVQEIDREHQAAVKQNLGTPSDASAR
ncbi:MAG: hypothetical protein ABI612_01960 [Betaproteobacteria bacterium]